MNSASKLVLQEANRWMIRWETTVWRKIWMLTTNNGFIWRTISFFIHHHLLMSEWTHTHTSMTCSMLIYSSSPAGTLCHCCKQQSRCTVMCVHVCVLSISFIPPCASCCHALPLRCTEARGLNSTCPSLNVMYVCYKHLFKAPLETNASLCGGVNDLHWHQGFLLQMNTLFKLLIIDLDLLDSTHSDSLYS